MGIEKKDEVDTMLLAHRLRKDFVQGVARCEDGSLTVTFQTPLMRSPSEIQMLLRHDLSEFAAEYLGAAAVANANRDAANSAQPPAAQPSMAPGMV